MMSDADLEEYLEKGFLPIWFEGEETIFKYDRDGVKEAYKMGFRSAEGKADKRVMALVELIVNYVKMERK